ncbi:hypothetical protein ABIE00_002160 [Arthrobacter sp. OAP107]
MNGVHLLLGLAHALPRAAEAAAHLRPLYRPDSGGCHFTGCPLMGARPRQPCGLENLYARAFARDDLRTARMIGEAVWNCGPDPFRRFDTKRERVISRGS